MTSCPEYNSWSNTILGTLEKTYFVVSRIWRLDDSGAKVYLSMQYFDESPTTVAMMLDGLAHGSRYSDHSLTLCDHTTAIKFDPL